MKIFRMQGAGGYAAHLAPVLRLKSRLKRWHVILPDGKEGDGPTVAEAVADALSDEENHAAALAEALRAALMEAYPPMGVPPSA